MTIKPSITCTVSQSYPLQTNGKWINDGLIKKSDLWTVKEIFGIEPWMIPRATITTITNFLKINVTKAAALNYIQTDEGSALWGSHAFSRVYSGIYSCIPSKKGRETMDQSSSIWWLDNTHGTKPLSHLAQPKSISKTSHHANHNHWTSPCNMHEIHYNHT